MCNLSLPHGRPLSTPHGIFALLAVTDAEGRPSTVHGPRFQQVAFLAFGRLLRAGAVDEVYAHRFVEPPDAARSTPFCRAGISRDQQIELLGSRNDIDAFEARSAGRNVAHPGAERRTRLRFDPRLELTRNANAITLIRLGHCRFSPLASTKDFENENER